MLVLVLELSDVLNCPLSGYVILLHSERDDRCHVVQLVSAVKKLLERGRGGREEREKGEGGDREKEEEREKRGEKESERKKVEEKEEIHVHVYKDIILCTVEYSSEVR